MGRHCAFGELVAEQPGGVRPLDSDPLRAVIGCKHLVLQRQSTDRNGVDLGQSRRGDVAAEAAARKRSLDFHAERFGMLVVEEIRGAGVEHERLRRCTVDGGFKIDVVVDQPERHGDRSFLGGKYGVVGGRRRRPETVGRHGLVLVHMIDPRRSGRISDLRRRGRWFLQAL